MSRTDHTQCPKLIQILRKLKLCATIAQILFHNKPFVVIMYMEMCVFCIRFLSLPALFELWMDLLTPRQQEQKYVEMWMGGKCLKIEG